MSDFKTEDRYKNLDRVNTWVANCDTKASYLLTLLSLIFTIVATSSYSAVLLNAFEYSWINGSLNLQAFLRFVEAVSLYFCLCFLLKTLNSIYHVLFAKIDPSIFGQQDLISNSLLFFGTIEKQSFVEFSEKSKQLNETELQKHIDSQTYINSKICQLKFENYNSALKFCRHAFVAGLIFLAVKWFLLRLS